MQRPTHVPCRAMLPPCILFLLVRREPIRPGRGWRRNRVGVPLMQVRDPPVASIPRCRPRFQTENEGEEPRENAYSLGISVQIAEYGGVAARTGHPPRRGEPTPSHAGTTAPQPTSARKPTALPQATSVWGDRGSPRGPPGRPPGSLPAAPSSQRRPSPRRPAAHPPHRKTVAGRSGRAARRHLYSLPAPHRLRVGCVIVRIPPFFVGP